MIFMFKQSYKKAKKKLSEETLQEIMLILEREDLSLSTKAKQIKVKEMGKENVGDERN